MAFSMSSRSCSDPQHTLKKKIGGWDPNGMHLSVPGLPTPALLGPLHTGYTMQTWMQPTAFSSKAGPRTKQQIGDTGSDGVSPAQACSCSGPVLRGGGGHHELLLALASLPPWLGLSPFPSLPSHKAPFHQLGFCS